MGGTWLCRNAPSIQAPITRSAIECPIGIHWKQRPRKKLGATESKEVSEFREFNERLAEGGFLYIELFNF
jgi:hypothetical protein